MTLELWNCRVNNKRGDISKYWSIYRQYVCHTRTGYHKFEVCQYILIYTYILCDTEKGPIIFYIYRPREYFFLVTDLGNSIRVHIKTLMNL